MNTMNLFLKEVRHQGLANYGHLIPSIVMEERNRIAREIHDTFAQEFAGILLHLAAAEVSENLEGYCHSENLARVRELATRGLEDARIMLLSLRPKSPEGTTLSDALRRLVERFSYDYELACEFCAEGQEPVLSAETQHELYRIAQEAFCNVRKHSLATAASLSLNYGHGEVELKITDNGQGFATVRHQMGGQGYGLTTMRERAEHLGGRIEINSAPRAGTEVIVVVPCCHYTPRKE